jgi:hypothetical protein
MHRFAAQTQRLGSGCAKYVVPFIVACVGGDNTQDGIVVGRTTIRQHCMGL